MGTRRDLIFIYIILVYLLVGTILLYSKESQSIPEKQPKVEMSHSGNDIPTITIWCDNIDYEYWYDCYVSLSTEFLLVCESKNQCFKKKELGYLLREAYYFTRMASQSYDMCWECMFRLLAQDIEKVLYAKDKKEATYTIRLGRSFL